MKLQWAQLKPHDETLFALMYLSEDAALWRDVQFTQAHAGTTGIPTAVFEAELVQQFIPMTVALQADRDFAQIRQKQGVDHYNREFVMARDELAVMPHVQQPDVSTQTKVYLAGLKPHIREALGGRLTQADLKDLSKLMAMAAEVEAVTVSLGFIAGQSGRHDTQAGGARRDMPKQPSGSAGAGRDRNHAKPQRSQGKFTGQYATVQEGNTWARSRGLPEQTDSVGIKYCVPGLGGWRFPDIAWKDAHFNQATSNTPRRCTYCHNLQEEQQGKDPTSGTSGNTALLLW